MFKKEFNANNLFLNHEIMVDSGYQGIESDYIAKHISIPYKKPRKSKNNPNPELTKEQKDYNREIAKKRVFAEHAISGIKRYNCLSNKFRNNRESGMDFNMLLAATGLWNFNLMNK